MKVRLFCAFLLTAVSVTFGTPSRVAFDAHLAVGARVVAAAAQGDACGAILGADLGLPHTTITVAEEVRPPFTPPETFSSRGFTVEDVSFCRVAGMASPVAGSDLSVEQDAAPERLIASKVVDGEVRRTRPLCAYPQVARYDGSGSIDDAANFACVNPD